MPKMPKIEKERQDHENTKKKECLKIRKKNTEDRMKKPTTKT